MESVFSPPQIVAVRGRRWFLCQYTGCAIYRYFYVPGDKPGVHYGCFATLPILLRALLEIERGETERFNRVKSLLEDFYTLPNISIQAPLSPDRMPLSLDELAAYLEDSEKGFAWLLIPGSEPVPPLSTAVARKNTKPRKKPRKRKGRNLT